MSRSLKKSKPSNKENKTNSLSAVNQKKVNKPVSSNSIPVNQNHYTLFSENIYRGNAYMATFVKPVPSDKFSCICIKCKSSKKGQENGKIMLVNSITANIGSPKHKENTPESELKQLERLITLLNEPGKKKYEDKDEKVKKEKKLYIDFLAFLMSKNLSYSQIEDLGKYLKERYKKNDLGFLKNSSFDEHLISKITKDCFQFCLIQDLKEKLQSVQYSLIIDNATFSSENLCALKVKFLEKSYNEETKSEINFPIEQIHRRKKI